MNLRGTMEFKDYLKVIRRRWPWFAGVVVLFAAIYGGFYFREQPQYLATAKVLIRIETADAYINSALRPQFPGLTTATREALLSADPVLQNAVLIYGAQLALESKALDGASQAVKDAFQARKVVVVDREMVTRSDLARDLLAMVRDRPLPASVGAGTFGDFLSLNSAPSRRINDRLAAVKVAKTNEKLQFVNVTLQGADPADACLLVNSVAYAGEDWSLNDTTKDFEKALKENGEEQTRLVEQKRDLAKTSAEIEDVEGRRSLARQGIVALRGRSDQLVSDRRKVEKSKTSQREGDHEDIFGIGRVGPASTNEVQEIERQIRALDLQVEHLLEVHTEELRDVKQIRRQRKVLDAQLAAARTNATAERRAYLDAELKYYEEEIADVDERIQAATTEAEGLTNRLDTLRPAREELSNLEMQLGKVTGNQADLKILVKTLHGFISVTKPADAATPQPKSMEKSWAFWMLMSLIVGLGVSYFREYLDTSILTEYDVRRHLTLPVLGLIPELAKIGAGRAVLGDEVTHTPLSETFNTIGTLVRTAMTQEGWKSVLIASANPSEGKTFVSIQLALSLARKGLRVILIDSDMRKPQIHATLGLENSVGLSTILEGRMEAREQVGEAIGEAAPGGTLDAYIQRTEVLNLQVITSGPVPQSPVRLLESQRMRDLMTELRERADFIIFDTPPICSVGDCITLATIVDVVLYVVGAGYSEQQDATWSKHLLNNVQANLLGVVMNRMEALRSREYYYYYTRDRKNVRPGT